MTDQVPNFGKPKLRWHRFSIPMLLIGLLAFSGCGPSDEQQAVEAYNRGVAYYDKGEYDKAIAAFTVAIRLDPTDAEAYYNRGVAYTEEGEPDKAIADFDDAIRLDPTYAKAYYNRGVIYGERGEPDKAIADHRPKRSGSIPTDAMAYYNRGNAWDDKGEDDKAIADYDEAIERLDPKDAISLLQPGRRLRGKGEPDKAIADYDEAIRLDPTDANAYCNRGARLCAINSAIMTRPSPTMPRLENSDTIRSSFRLTSNEKSNGTKVVATPARRVQHDDRRNHPGDRRRHRRRESRVLVELPQEASRRRGPTQRHPSGYQDG